MSLLEETRPNERLLGSGTRQRRRVAVRPESARAEQQVCRVAAGCQDDLEGDGEGAYRVQAASASEDAHLSGGREPDSDRCCTSADRFAHEYALVWSSCRSSDKLQVLGKQPSPVVLPWRGAGTINFDAFDGQQMRTHTQTRALRAQETCPWPVRGDARHCRRHHGSAGCGVAGVDGDQAQPRMKLHWLTGALRRSCVSSTALRCGGSETVSAGTAGSRRRQAQCAASSGRANARLSRAERNHHARSRPAVVQACSHGTPGLH